MNNLDKFTEKDGKYTYKLLSPIQFGSKLIAELELVEPKAKHIRMLPSNPLTDDTLKIVGNLCGQPDSFIDELSLKDANELSSFIEAFA